ncbi:MAG: tetratricopeptide repeat protein, partial [Leptolyngbya sp.]|nr:tetratricopeptide repeat protein [Candidatus Melainabacteria bacterium]
MKSIKNFALSSLLILAQAFSINSCLANEFPGTGSKDAWQQAWQMSNQGNSLLQAGQHAQGFELLHKAIEIYPGDAELLYSLAGAHQAYAHMTTSEVGKVTELEKAEVYLKQAAKLKPSQAEVLIRMANIQSELKKDSESIANLQTVLAMTTLDASVRQKTAQALQYVQSKSNSTQLPNTPSTATSTQAVTGSTTSFSEQHWQTYTAPSSLFSLQYPNGWSISTDPKSGKIEAKNSSGANLAILPFYTSEKLGNTTGFFTALLKSLAPQEQWSKPETVSTALRSSYISAKEKAVAVLEIFPITNGTGGKICVAKSPIGNSAVPFDVFGKMLTSLRFNTEAIASASKPAATSSNYAAPNLVAKNNGDSESSENSNGSKSDVGSSVVGSSNAGTSPANPIFGSYQIFNDPKENAFSVEVP